jgi:hypothetical protein
MWCTSHANSPLERRRTPTPESRLRNNWRLIATIATVAAAVLALQAFLHGHFSALDEYDDGVYFGASIELVHGVVAYRDFAFIQPPFITVWLLPFAALSSSIGTAGGMEVARFFVDLVTVANIVLVGALVRRRPSLQVAAATGVMAFSEGTIRSSQTILLEPFLVLACLMALLCLLDGDGITSSSRRTWWAGVFFGVAGATKVWAVLPLLAAVIVLWRIGSSPVRRVVGGALIGFGVCTIPFIVGAPTAFFQQVVLTQAIRNRGGLTFRFRLADLTGLPGLSALHGGGFPIGLFLLATIVTVVFGAILINRRRFAVPLSSWSPLERFALWGTVLVGAGLLLSPTYYYHYSGFMAPFVAVLLSCVIERSARRHAHPLGGQSGRLPGALLWVAVASGLALYATSTINEIVHLPAAPHVDDAISDAIPGHGCVLYSNPGLALLDNRFTADVSGCPSVIDWLGQERVLDKGRAVSRSDARNRALQEAMTRWIASSDAVVLVRGDLGIDSANISYLHNHFDRQDRVPGRLRIYVRETRSHSPTEEYESERARPIGPPPLATRSK